MNDAFFIKGDICYSKNEDTLHEFKNAYLYCQNGKSEGVLLNIPSDLQNIPVYDYSGCIVIPGFIDLHTHASQYKYRGIGTDLLFSDWMNKLNEQEKIYLENNELLNIFEDFVRDYKNSLSVRACIFASSDTNLTLKLMELLETNALPTFVGKVLDLSSITERRALVENLKWLSESNKFKYAKPIYSPKYLDDIFSTQFSEILNFQSKMKVNMQTHYCEEAKRQNETIKKENVSVDNKIILTHCVDLSPEEINFCQNENIFICICPETNLNYLKTIAPIRKYLKYGLNIGLGTDVAGGSSLSIFNSMKYCIQSSKIYSNYIDSSAEPLTFPEVFYFATRGGGNVFGNCGSFDKGYDFDAVIIKDSFYKNIELSLKERLECMMNTNFDKCIIESKIIRGKKIF